MCRKRIMSPAHKSGHSVRSHDFEISPHQLVGKPEGHAGGEERPKQSQAAVGPYGVGNWESAVTDSSKMH